MIQEFYETFYDNIRRSRRVAYRHYNERLSYEELYYLIRCFNSLLSGRRGHRVAVYADKSIVNYASLFSIILSNNTWVPINPDLPENRNAEMLLLAKPELLLTDRRLPENFLLTLGNIGTEVVTLEEVMGAPRGPEFKFSEISKSDLAMIYFTSGSTGRPKGVLVTHENYIRNVRNIIEIVGLKRGEVFADYHDLSFVISVPILFPCVMSEGTLVPAIQKQDRMLPIRNMVENCVSILITVPTTMARIRQMRKDGFHVPNLKMVLMCGEPFHLDILNYILTKLEVDQVYDFYGSTELAPWAFYHKCSVKDLSQFEAFGLVPIGKPIVENSVAVRDSGELWLSGPQLTPGYLGDEGSDRFVKLNGSRWYKTGDKVVIHDGLYLCKGRLDSQVKIGGYRVELMDIEAHLRSMDGVDRAICFVEDEGGKKSIIAALHANREIDLVEVREHLKKRLPTYMMPRKSFVLKELPLNKSGKIDRITIQEDYKNSLSDK